LLKAAAFGLLLGLLGIIANVSENVRGLEEHVGLGLLFHLRGATKAPSDAVVVAIDRESSERLIVSTNPDRWPRSLHARLIEALSRAGARVIVFDLYFAEPRSPEDDAALAEAIKKAGNVILAEQLRAKEIASTTDAESDPGGHRLVETLRPIESLSTAAFATAPFVLPRMPVRVSQYWTFQTDAGDRPTFPVLALQFYTLEAYPDIQALLEKASPKLAGRLPRDPSSAIKTTGAAKFTRDLRQLFHGDFDVNDALARDAAGPGRNHRWVGALVNLYAGANRQYLNFYGPPRSVTTVPYYQALQIGDDAIESAPVDLRGKAVFVGLSENLLAERQDSFHTVFSKANGVFISGVEIAATAFLNLLTNTAVKPLRPSYQMAALLVWGIIVGVICRTTAPLSAAIGIFLCSAAYLFAASNLFRANAAWFPIVVPLFVQAPVGYLGALLWDYVEVNTERKNIRQALGYYVPEEIVTQLARNVVDIRRDGQTVYGACLFTDIADYTHVSETLPPRELSELMHQYHEATFAPIHKRGGRVVELKGDSILAIWKGSSDDLSLRRNACEAALEIASAVRRFNESNHAVQLPTRVSVHAGEIFLGSIGAGAHYEFGGSGDTITTASRLDGLNKHLRTSILVSAEVIRDLSDVPAREVGNFLLQGKSQAVLVYELISRAADCADRQETAGVIFAEARQAFAQRQWDEAKKKFAKLTGDGVSEFYLELCKKYRADPPPEGWHGTIAMREK
jgi:adenylate cyclase